MSSFLNLRRYIVVNHWWQPPLDRGWKGGEWAAGEWVPYQVKLDHKDDIYEDYYAARKGPVHHTRRIRNDQDSPLIYVASDGDGLIRAAAPASPRRLVRQLKSPALRGEDWDVGYLRLRREPRGKEEEEEVIGMTVQTLDEEAIAADVAAEAAEETRCANCGRCSAENRACRGEARGSWTPRCVYEGSRMHILTRIFESARLPVGFNLRLEQQRLYVTKVFHETNLCAACTGRETTSRMPRFLLLQQRVSEGRVGGPQGVL